MWLMDTQGMETPPALLFMAANEAILAEPLDYIGAYSERHMFDELGLLPPKIVNLERRGSRAPAHIEARRPDYCMIRCNDALRWLAGEETATALFNEHNMRLVTINSVAFRPSDVYEDPSYGMFARYARYDIWAVR